MYQKLLTKEVLDKLPPLYSQDGVKDPMVWVKIFHPIGSWTLFILEYSPKERLFFGWNPMDGELGYSRLEEIESVKVRGMGMERDMHFSPKPLSWVKGGREHDKYVMPKAVPSKRVKKSGPSGLGGTR
jgi:hypothetical protein